MSEKKPKKENEAGNEAVEKPKKKVEVAPVKAAPHAAPNPTTLEQAPKEAEKTQATARAAFTKTNDDSSGLPTTIVDKNSVTAGIPVVDLFVSAGLASSKAAARRLIEQGGVYVNDKKVTDVATVVRENSFTNGVCVIRRGKKQHHRVKIE